MEAFVSFVQAPEADLCPVCFDQRLKVDAERVATGVDVSKCVARAIREAMGLEVLPVEWLDSSH